VADANVKILGQTFNIKGDTSVEHIHQLADFVNAKVAEVMRSYPGSTPNNALILALFNVADELFRLREDQEDISRHLKERADMLASLFE
jgi:cell division protein ZapA